MASTDAQNKPIIKIYKHSWGEVTLLKTLEGHRTADILEIAFSEKDEKLISLASIKGAMEYEVIIWDIEQGKALGKQSFKTAQVLKHITIANNRNVFALRTQQSTILVCNLDANTQKEIKLPDDDVIDDLQLEAEASHLVCASRDYISRYDLSNDSVQKIKNPTSMTQITLSPSGRFALFASWSGKAFKMMRFDW